MQSPWERLDGSQRTARGPQYHESYLPLQQSSERGNEWRSELRPRRHLLRHPCTGRILAICLFSVFGFSRYSPLSVLLAVEVERKLSERMLPLAETIPHTLINDTHEDYFGTGFVTFDDAGRLFIRLTGLGTYNTTSGCIDSCVAGFEKLQAAKATQLQLGLEDVPDSGVVALVDLSRGLGCSFVFPT
eukprot:TRINITY_DN29481_c0_g1_i2.p1 TRINITY_DN29481_c0_g1~~TRINITY_DN29481_c0_g1_i2.p1  ORF type:complete len:188 (+),score=9.24 TRINITY_DN29481_c0_g1_i2:173-736(+)